MKNTNFRTSLQRKMTLAALTGIIALPTLVTVPALQADQARNTSAWRQRDDNKSGSNQNWPGNSQNKPAGDAHRSPAQDIGVPSDNRGNDNRGNDNRGNDNRGNDNRDNRNRSSIGSSNHNFPGRSGFDAGGFDQGGRDRSGFDHDGFDRNGHDRNGHDRNRHPVAILGRSNPGNWGGFNNYDSGYSGRSATIFGTVIDSLNMENTLRICTDDGEVYIVPTGSARYFYVGNRVRVSGQLDGGTLFNANVSRQ